MSYRNRPIRVFLFSLLVVVAGGLGAPAHAQSGVVTATPQGAHAGLDSATVAALASALLVAGTALIAGVRITRRKW